MGDSAALVEVFQGVDAGIEGDPAADRIQGLHNGSCIQTLVPQLCGVFQQKPLAAGGVGTVIDMAQRAIHQIAGHHRVLIGAAELGGEGDIEDLFSLVPGVLEQIHEDLGGRLGGLGQLPGMKQQFVELVLGQIDIFLVFSFAEEDCQRNAGDIQAFQVAGLKIRGRVCNESYHVSSYGLRCQMQRYDNHTGQILRIS